MGIKVDGDANRKRLDSIAEANVRRAFLSAAPSYGGRLLDDDGGSPGPGLPITTNKLLQAHKERTKAR